MERSVEGVTEVDCSVVVVVEDGVRTELWREGVVEEERLVESGCVGVVAPEEKAERPAEAGVEGGGRGEKDVSEVVAEKGRGVSGIRGL
jgi:hypothetical protein